MNFQKTTDKVINIELVFPIQNVVKKDGIAIDMRLMHNNFVIMTMRSNLMKSW